MKAAEAKLAAVDAERRKEAELAGDISLELAAADRKSGRLEKQIIKLEKQLARLKEEKTELKKQVVADGKIVVSEKIHKRQQAELASHRKSKKHNTFREQNAEALVPFRDDLEKIKEMIHDVEVNEAETVAFSEQREMRKKLRIPDSVEWIPDSVYWSPIWRKKNFTDPKSAFFDREYECIF